MDLLPGNHYPWLLSVIDRETGTGKVYKGGERTGVVCLPCHKKVTVEQPDEPQSPACFMDRPPTAATLSCGGNVSPQIT